MNSWAALLQNPAPYTQDPEIYSQTPGSVNDLAEAMRNRYGDDPSANARGFLHEIGPLHGMVSMENSPTSTQFAGDYDPSKQVMNLGSGLTKDEQLATIAHESAHAADQLSASTPWSTPDKPGKYSTEHFQHFANFEPEMAQSMWSQKAIEEGLPVNPQILSHYSWLNKVHALSSQPLANPWTGAHRRDDETTSGDTRN